MTEIDQKQNVDEKIYCIFYDIVDGGAFVLPSLV